MIRAEKSYCKCLPKPDKSSKTLEGESKCLGRKRKVHGVSYVCICSLYETVCSLPMVGTLVNEVHTMFIDVHGDLVLACTLLIMYDLMANYFFYGSVYK